MKKKIINCIFTLITIFSAFNNLNGQQIHKIICNGEDGFERNKDVYIQSIELINYKDRFHFGDNGNYVKYFDNFYQNKTYIMTFSVKKKKKYHKIKSYS